MARLGAESANAQKSKQMSRVGDEGTAHAKGGREGMPFNAMLRLFLPSTRSSRFLFLEDIVLVGQFLALRYRLTKCYTW